MAKPLKSRPDTFGTDRKYRKPRHCLFWQRNKQFPGKALAQIDDSNGRFYLVEDADGKKTWEHESHVRLEVSND